MEDGCRPALPYSVGANGFALRADGSALNTDNVDGRLELYQIGQNPYVPCRNTQRYQVLEALARHVESGTSKVGEYGVDEPDTIFHDADTEEGRYEYMVPL